MYNCKEEKPNMMNTNLRTNLRSPILHTLTVKYFVWHYVQASSRFYYTLLYHSRLVLWLGRGGRWGIRSYSPICPFRRVVLWDHSILNSQTASFNTAQNTVHKRIKGKCISYVQLPVFQLLQHRNSSLWAPKVLTKNWISNFTREW